MSLVRELYRGENKFDFVPVWKWSVIVSATLAVASLLLLVTVGLDLSIDFEGGGVWEVPVEEGVGVAEARDAITGMPDARIQLVEDPDRGNFLRVQSGTADLDRSPEVVADLAELAGTSPDEVSVSTVGPTWGSQITSSAVRALILFFVAVALYLAWRLEWRMAIGALLAVVHDLALTAGVYAVFSFEVSPATVIALLTILGYSLYDTVVVYDKVLENQKAPVADTLTSTRLINHSMNQVLMRSVNTTITTVLPVVSMLVIGGVLGGASLRDFALALFIGLILGTYSSIFLAAPVLAWLKEREPAAVEHRQRLEQRAAKRAERAAAPEDDTTPSANGTTAGAAPAAMAGPINPRPRKRRRR